MKNSIAVLILLIIVNPMLYSMDLHPVGEAAPEWDALFQRTRGWIGADGNYSVPMGNGRTLWLFSDTFVGEVKDGRRVNARMINNSIALQDGMDEPEFFYRVREDGTPASFIKPADGRGFFWLFGGVRTDAGLYLFLSQVDIETPGIVFGFRVIGSWLCHVKNPDAPPLEWDIEQRKMPCGLFTKDGDLIFVSARVRDGGYIYLYGNDSRRNDDGEWRGTVVARVREENLGDFSEWRYFADGEWQEDFMHATPIAPNAGTEFSVSFLPLLKKYVIVYTEGLGGRAVMRTSPTPVGPWSDAVEFFQTPEMDWPGEIFCYAGKAHPHLAGPDELLVTYAANSLDSGQVMSDARLYWPRFVRVRFAPADGPGDGRE